MWATPSPPRPPRETKKAAVLPLHTVGRRLQVPVGLGAQGFVIRSPHRRDVSLFVAELAASYLITDVETIVNVKKGRRARPRTIPAACNGPIDPDRPQLAPRAPIPA